MVRCPAKIGNKVCGRKPGRKFLDTGFCGKHQSLAKNKLRQIVVDINTNPFPSDGFIVNETMVHVIHEHNNWYSGWVGR